MTETPYKCAACAAAFETEAELERHAGQMHAGTTAPPAASPAASPAARAGVSEEAR
jgi:hypothetical protein